MLRWLALFLCVVLIQGANAQSESFGRLSRTQGEVLVLKLGSTDWEYGVSNLLIEEGDLLKTGMDDFAEIELENGTLIWMDEGTKLRVLYLCKDIDYGEWVNEIEVIYGKTRVRTPDLPGWDARLDIETPTGSVRIGEESTVKVEVRKSGASRVIAYSGDVIVSGEWDELSLEPGEAVWISSSGELEYPRRIYARREDRFDRWCDKYRYDYCESRRYIHTDIYIGVQLLDTYGDWVFIDYGWVWRPRVRPGWCPYRHGRWVWSVGFGWFWVSYDPWGWIPFHYGRWAYSPLYGWVWVPGNVWGPGWVAWAWGPGWIAWTPLGPGDCPILGVDNAYTTVSYDCFSAKPKTSMKEGYSKYLEVKVAKEKWNKSLPKQVNEAIQVRAIKNRSLRHREIGRKPVARSKEKELLDRSQPRNKRIRAFSQPKRIYDHSEVIYRRERSTPGKKLYIRAENTEVKRRVRPESDKVIRKPRRSVPDKEKPKVSARKSKDANSKKPVVPQRRKRVRGRSNSVK